MKQHLTKILSAFFFSAFILSMGCNKSSTDPGALAIISTYSVINSVTTTSAQASSVINGNGAFSINAVGVCWSATNQNPTIADSKTSNSVDSISFVSNITGLAPNTTYYVRGYITDPAGTTYSGTTTFKTNSATYTSTATVSTFAGSLTAGFVNALGTSAQFYNPTGICTDLQGNMYVADSFYSVIRKITPAGTVTTYAGTGTSGYTDGPATSAQFYAPTGVTADAQGNIYVADMGNNMIRKISTTGVVSTLAGRYTAGYVDATGTSAAFKSPTGVAVDAQGNVFVADQGNNMIRKVTSAGVVTTLAGNITVGQVDATGTLAYFNAPSSLAIDAQGNLYVADSKNYSIRKVTTAGVVTTITGNYVLKTQIFTPAGICLDTKGDIFVADPTGRIFEITAANVLFPLAGAANTNGFVNGTNTTAQFNSPQSLTADAQGNIYVVDYYNNMIRKITVATTP